MEIKENDIIRCVSKSDRRHYDNVCILRQGYYRFFDLQQGRMTLTEFDGQGHTIPMNMFQKWGMKWDFYLVGTFSPKKITNFEPIPIKVELRKIVKRVIRD